jgi:hypothetical protein
VLVEPEASGGVSEIVAGSDGNPVMILAALERFEGSGIRVRGDHVQRVGIEADDAGFRALAAKKVKSWEGDGVVSHWGC